MKNFSRALFLTIWAASSVGATFLSRSASGEPILQENSELPITIFNLSFRVGSADDPRGKEGLAYLTGRLLREGGVKAWKDLPARNRAELEEFLFPFAADIGISVQKEQTSFEVSATAGDAPTIFGVLSQLLLAPAFNEAELERLRAETLDTLEKQLPREDEEELGKAALDQAMYGKEHPYGHVVQGTVAGIKSITVKDIEGFYKAHFTQRRLVLGIAGVIPKSLASDARAVTKQLPKGTTAHADIPPSPTDKQSRGRHLLIVKGPFDAVGVHLGLPVPFTRASPEFAPMYLASTAFGKHRSFVGRLMHKVREVRGLNYGTYSYVEDFPNGGQLTTEPTQVARTRQAFTVWARPTPLENGCFLLRQVLREVQSLGSEGLTKEEFELGQSHLIGNIPLLGAPLERSLGYSIDSRFYGIHGNYLMNLVGQIRKTSLKKVNAAAKKFIHPTDLRIVVVTPEPEKFKTELLGARCDIHYAPGTVKPKEVIEEDNQIATFASGIDPKNISIIDADALFSN